MGEEATAFERAAHVPPAAVCSEYLRSFPTHLRYVVSQEQMVSVSGRNWGDALVDNASLTFKVDKKPAFSIALPDVSQVRALGLANAIYF